MLKADYFSSSIPVQQRFLDTSSPSVDEEDDDTRKPEQSRKELKQRTFYLAGSVPFLLAFLYMPGRLYDCQKEFHALPSSRKFFAMRRNA